MSKYECSQEDFLNIVKNHVINIVKDDGVYKHIQFTNPDSKTNWFDLITWPGNLCITGDYGTFVFCRNSDMFQFFRMNMSDFNYNKDILLNINPGYWSEKLQSVNTTSGYKQYSKEKFEEQVKEYFDDHMNPDIEDDDMKANLWDAIKEEVLYYSDYEHEAYDAIYKFEFGGIRFQDFFDGGYPESYTYHYIWCLYAIVWGIMKYDEDKINQVNDRIKSINEKWGNL